MDADHARALMQERLDFGGEFLREIFKLRAETGLHPLSGPHQLLAESRQRRALAAMSFHQWHAEEFGPLLDQIPGVPIGEVGVLAALVSFPVSRIPLRISEHDHGGLWTAFLMKAPDGLDLDMQHRSVSL